MRRALPVLLLALAAGAAHAQPRTIVGFWHAPDQPCTRAGGAIRLLPMGLESEDATCRFTSVRREGNSVIWQGGCDDAEGGSGQSVIATETEAGLTLRFRPGGTVLTGLRRCARPPAWP